MSSSFRWKFPKYLAIVNIGGNKDLFEIKSYASKEQMIRYTKGYNATVYEHNGTDYIKLPQDDMAKVYKIRDKTSGMFSTGGECYITLNINFTKNGKVWTSVSNLSQHLTLACNTGVVKVNGKNVGFDLSKLDPHHPYHNCEILEADIQFHPVKDVTDFLDKKLNSRCKAEDALK